MVKVSVIIPVYNAEKYLRQCLDSVLGQTLKEIELICVDDGSTDGSTEILLAYAGKDKRIRVITQKNGGPGKARNTALPYATGKYISFLDADDWFEQDFLEKMFDRSNEVQADICICETQRFDDATGEELPSEWMLKKHLVPTGVFSPEDIADHLFQFTYGQVWDKLYRRAFLQETGIQFPEFRNSEDMPFVYKTLLSAKRIVVLPNIMVHYRVNRSGSVSNSVVVQPDAPYEAFRLVMDHLEKKCNKELFQQSFLNWAMEFLIWQVCNIPDETIRRKYFDGFRNSWMYQLDFDKYPSNYYYHWSAYIKFLTVKHTPYWVFSLLLSTYKKIVK